MWTLVFKQPGQPEKQYVLNGKEMRIGRSRRCELHLDDPRVSGYHARIIPEDGNYYLQDLGSTNGTYLNGQRIGRVLLAQGAKVQIADYQILVIATPAEQAKAAEAELSFGEISVAQTGKQDPQDVAELRASDRGRTRRGENTPSPFRSGRFFSVNGQWFFATREGQEYGPFKSMALARAAFIEYGRKMGFLNNEEDEKVFHF